MTTPQIDGNTAQILSVNSSVSSNTTSQRGLDFSKVTALLQKGASDHVYPGAVLLIGRAGQALYHFSVGNKWVAAPDGIKNEMSRDTVFDISSLSALVITTTLIMKLVEANQIRLEDKLTRYIQAFGVSGKSTITIEQLLSHSAGLPHWLPFFEELVAAHAGPRIGILTSRGARDYILNSLNRIELKHVPGTKQLYSDLGFILLGALIETMTGMRLDRAAHKLILQPLGMRSSSFIELAMIKRRGIHPVRDRIAPTEECGWRKRVLCGEVHDDNAWAMGGIAGHSGLFSNANDLHLFASEIINAYRGDSNFLRRPTLHRFFSAPKSVENSSDYKLGWESPNRENAMIDSKLSQNSVGICGFSGCSLWIDPEKGIDIILLTNRIHPDRSNKRIRDFRPELHTLILEALGH